MKKVLDLVFSYFFVVASVFTGGLALKLFYDEQYIQALVLFVAVIYLFGVGCMGLNRLSLYIKGKCNNGSYKTSIQRS